MQSLYEWDFRSGAVVLSEIVERNSAEFRKDLDHEYVQRVMDGVIANLDGIDAAISAAAPEWPLDQVAKVDKNILRVAVYEMLFDPSEDVPPRVSINEAVEVGKTFGSESTSKFVNGVLGSIYRAHESTLRPRDEIKPAAPAEPEVAVETESSAPAHE